MAKPKFIAKAAPVPDAASSGDTVVANPIVPCTTLYHLVSPCTRWYRSIHASTTWHASTYWLGPRNYLCQYVLAACTNLRFLVWPCSVSTSVLCTGLYQYLLPCTTLYQGYMIPDVTVLNRNETSEQIDSDSHWYCQGHGHCASLTWKPGSKAGVPWPWHLHSWGTVQTSSILVWIHTFITLLSARFVSCKWAHTTCFCNAIFFCVSTIKTALFQLCVCQICSVGSVVRVVRYITERLPVLIQAVCFCPSGESARTLFKSSE